MGASFLLGTVPGVLRRLASGAVSEKYKFCAVAYATIIGNRGVCLRTAPGVVGCVRLPRHELGEMKLRRLSFELLGLDKPGCFTTAVYMPQ